MATKIIALSNFKRRAKRLLKKYDSLTNDLQMLNGLLQQNPTQGTSLGAGLYKIRLAVESKGAGKSGGFRVITYFVDETETEQNVYLVTIYDKSEEGNIDKKELLRIFTSEME